MKSDVTLLAENSKSACNICDKTISSKNTEFLSELSLEDTEGLVSSSESLNHNGVSIAAYFLYKYARTMLQG